MYQRFERFSVAVAEISRHWHKLAGDEMVKHGLKSSHSLYLMTLARYDKGLTAPQICELCGKDKSDVSRMMRILEDKGIITKDGGFQNRYGGLFRLTDEGRRIAGHIRSRVTVAVDMAGSGLTDEQREIFYMALEAIAAKLRELSKEGLPER